MPSPTVTHLARMQTAKAGQVLARAFHPDPPWNWIIPDEDERSQVLPWFMERGLLYCAMFGEAHTTEGQILGAAGWLTPGNTRYTAHRIAEAGMNSMAEHVGADNFARFAAMSAHLARHRTLDESVDYYYLSVVGVEPSRQGQGIGVTLLRPVLKRADQEGMSCYLETAKAWNVPFYEKQGFVVAGESDLPNGPHFWSMRRDPRRGT